MWLTYLTCIVIISIIHGELTLQEAFQNLRKRRLGSDDEPVIKSIGERSQMDIIPKQYVNRCKVSIWNAENDQIMYDTSENIPKYKTAEDRELDFNCMLFVIMTKFGAQIENVPNLAPPERTFSDINGEKLDVIYSPQNVNIRNDPVVQYTRENTKGFNNVTPDIKVFFTVQYSEKSLRFSNTLITRMEEQGLVHGNTIFFLIDNPPAEEKVQLHQFVKAAVFGSGYKLVKDLARDIQEQRLPKAIIEYVEEVTPKLDDRQTDLNNLLAQIDALRKHYEATMKNFQTIRNELKDREELKAEYNKIEKNLQIIESQSTKQTTLVDELKEKSSTIETELNEFKTVVGKYEKASEELENLKQR